MRASLAQLHARLVRDERLRDARPDGGDDARPAGRRDARRADRPGRRAAAALPGPERSLRRGLHRLAVDEPRRGDGGRETSSRSGSFESRSTRGGARRVASITSSSGVRPEAFNDAALAKQHLPRIDVTVDVLEELGSDSHVFFRVAAPRVTSSRATPPTTRRASSPRKTRSSRPGSIRRRRVGSALRCELAVDPSSFHFFDVRTGESLLSGSRRRLPASLADAGGQPAHEEALAREVEQHDRARSRRARPRGRAAGSSSSGPGTARGRPSSVRALSFCRNTSAISSSFQTQIACTIDEREGGRPRERHHDAPQHRERPGALDRGRLDQLLRDGAEEVRRGRRSRTAPAGPCRRRSPTAGG